MRKCISNLFFGCMNSDDVDDEFDVDFESDMLTSPGLLTVPTQYSRVPRLQYDVDMSTLPERMSMLNEARLLIEDVERDIEVSKQVEKCLDDCIKQVVLDFWHIDSRFEPIIDETNNPGLPVDIWLLIASFLVHPYLNAFGRKSYKNAISRDLSKDLSRYTQLIQFLNPIVSAKRALNAYHLMETATELRPMSMINRYFKDLLYHEFFARKDEYLKIWTTKIRPALNKNSSMDLKGAADKVVKLSDIPLEVLCRILSFVASAYEKDFGNQAKRRLITFRALGDHGATSSRIFFNALRDDGWSNWGTWADADVYRDGRMQNILDSNCQSAIEEVHNWDDWASTDDRKEGLLKSRCVAAIQQVKGWGAWAETDEKIQLILDSNCQPAIDEVVEMRMTAKDHMLCSKTLPAIRKNEDKISQLEAAIRENEDKISQLDITKPSVREHHTSEVKKRDVDKYNRLESRHLSSISRCNHFFHDLLRNELLSHKEINFKRGRQAFRRLLNEAHEIMRNNQGMQVWNPDDENLQIRNPVV